VLKTSLEPTPGALGEFGAGDLFDQGPSRPAAFGGPSDDVVERRSGGMQSDLGELPREVTGRGRCVLEQRLLMRGIGDSFVPVVAAAVARNLTRTVEDAHFDV